MIKSVKVSKFIQVKTPLVINFAFLLFTFAYRLSPVRLPIPPPKHEKKISIFEREVQSIELKKSCVRKITDIGRILCHNTHIKLWIR